MHTGGGLGKELNTNLKHGHLYFCIFCPLERCLPEFSRFFVYIRSHRVKNAFCSEWPSDFAWTISTNFPSESRVLKSKCQRRFFCGLLSELESIISAALCYDIKGCSNDIGVVQISI